jgi:hypothetical protein
LLGTDDVKVPDNEIGEQIEKEFEDGKEVSRPSRSYESSIPA